jgi:rRNA-processing protein FCF1
LLREVREAEDPAHLAVVTADRRLAERARQRGARVVAPTAFLARCRQT